MEYINNSSFKLLKFQIFLFEDFPYGEISERFLFFFPGCLIGFSGEAFWSTQSQKQFEVPSGKADPSEATTQ